MDWLKESRTKGQATGQQGYPKEVTVPAAQAGALRDLLRQGAVRVGVGLKLDQQDRPVPSRPGFVVVKFQAADKRKSDAEMEDMVRNSTDPQIKELAVAELEKRARNRKANADAKAKKAVK